MANLLSKIGKVPISTSALVAMYPDLKAGYNKVACMEKAGEIIRLKRGLYVVNPSENNEILSLELIANHIYGPSYVSRETALRYYGLIPEAVYLVRSMTTKHTRSFKNSLGQFEYTECDSNYFSIGIRNEVVDNISFLIASPEKALCDKILCTKGLSLRYRKEILAYLDEDIRLDMDAFASFDPVIFEECAKIGKKATILNNIAKILRQ